MDLKCWKLLVLHNNIVNNFHSFSTSDKDFFKSKNVLKVVYQKYVLVICCFKSRIKIKLTVSV